MSEQCVLVTEGMRVGLSRAAVAAVRALDRGGYRSVVTVSGGPSLAAASRACSRRVEVPPADEDPLGYAEAVRAASARDGYLAVLPASEAALLALDVPVRHLQDKAVAAHVAADVGLRVPPTRVLGSHDELLAAGSSFDYPIIVKPNLKRFAARLVARVAELPLVPDGGPYLVQPYLADALHGVLGLMWRGRLVGAAHLRYLRLWPRPCGTVAAAETMAPDPELEARLEALFRGYDGLFHVDLAGPYLLDVNPRLHATLPAAAAAGVDLVVMFCDLLRGRSVEARRARPGVFFRWLEGDVRSIAWSVRAGTMGIPEAVRALLPRPRVVHGYESALDPGPLVARVRAALS